MVLSLELVRMGIGAGMRAAMLLEVDLKLEGQLEEQLELNPRKPREIRPDPPKSGFLVQNGLPHCKRASNPSLGGTFGATFKIRKA